MDENPYRGPASPDANASGGNNRMLSSVLKGLAALAVVAVLVALLFPAVRNARPAFYRNHCTSNLRQIALALRAYADAHGALPPAYTVDADGKPLHSWRTLILPYLEERRLYEAIDLTKPWNDIANSEAAKATVIAYQCPAMPEDGNSTSYLAILTKNSCLQATEPRQLSDIQDGERETLIIMEVDVDHAVPWMSPVDADEQIVMDIGPKSHLAHAGGVNAAFVDGHVSFLTDDMPASMRRALISVAGNDKVEFDGAD